MDENNRLIRYSFFNPYKNLLAFSTTRQTVKNASPRYTGDSPKIFTENREQLAKILNISIDQLIFPRQTHSNRVATLSGIPEKELKKTDALITNQSEICLCVQTADCVPILLYDPEKHAIAAIHAGWRGTVKKIVASAVEKMKVNYGCSPKNLMALIGPSIGPKVYEVGHEVMKKAQKNIPNVEKTLYKNSADNFHFNLWEANRQLLIHCGMNPFNIEISEECSFTRSEKYFSARREGVHTGRMVTGIMLK